MVSMLSRLLGRRLVASCNGQQQHSFPTSCQQSSLRMLCVATRSKNHHHQQQQQRRHLSSKDTSSGWTLDHGTGIVSFNNGERRFQTIIGLEIHAQLDIPTKLFSPALTSSSSSLSSLPNDYENLFLHPLDAAIPGYFPVLSQEAVEAALVAATALNCKTIPSTSRFERKHYPYADLPLGYQITQQRWPLARNGFVHQASAAVRPVDKKTKKKGMKSSNSDDSIFKCRINRLQLEQDTGKTTTTTTTIEKRSVCSQNTTSHQMIQLSVEASRVDLNRAGCALIEIVTEPDIRKPKDAASLVETIRQLLAHVKVCSGRMERGQLRVDLNVNIEQISINDNSHGDESDAKKKRKRCRRRSPRVEVKNLNSIRQVQQAAEYEVLRQAREWRDDIDDGIVVDTINNNNHGDDTCGDTTADSSSSSSYDHDDTTRVGLSSLSKQETRTWNASTKQTVLIRAKDEAHDYRFLPEPDLPPLVLYPPTPPPSSSAASTSSNDNQDPYSDDDDHTDESFYLFPNESAMHDYIQATMPELPTQAVQRLVTQYALSDYQARVITSDPPAIAYFDRAYASAVQVVRQQQQTDTNNATAAADDDDCRHDKAGAKAATVASMVANYLCNDLFGLLKEHHQLNDELPDYGGYAASIQDSPVTAEQLGELVALVLNGTISKNMAKNLLAILYNAPATTTCTTNSSDDNSNSDKMTPLSVAQMAAKHGFKLVSDPVQLRVHVKKVFKNYIEAHDLERYLTMDDKVRAKLLKFFTGQCMAASKGNAEPEALREALEQVLLEMQQERNNNTNSRRRNDDD